MTSLIDRLGAPHLPWMEDGLCRQAEPEAWFPGTEHGQDPQTISSNTRLAKQMCWDCPVRQQCYQYALENDERHGIWGGHNFGE